MANVSMANPPRVVWAWTSTMLPPDWESTSERAPREPGLVDDVDRGRERGKERGKERQPPPSNRAREQARERRQWEEHTASRGGRVSTRGGVGKAGGRPPLSRRGGSTGEWAPLHQASTAAGARAARVVAQGSRRARGGDTGRGRCGSGTAAAPVAEDRVELDHPCTRGVLVGDPGGERRGGGPLPAEAFDKAGVEFAIGLGGGDAVVLRQRGHQRLDLVRGRRGARLIGRDLKGSDRRRARRRRHFGISHTLIGKDGGDEAVFPRRRRG